MLRNAIISLILLMCPAMGALAEERTDAAARLAELGLENVRVAEEDSCVYAAFEAVSYRGTFYGAAIGIEALGKLFPMASCFRVMLLENQNGQVALTALRDGGAWRVSGSYDWQDIDQALRQTARKNSSAGKIDLTVYPMFSWVNRRLDKLFEYVLSIAPTVEMSLWRGNRITLQPIIPISYDVKTIHSQKYVRVGIADIAQEFVSRNGRFQATLAGGFLFFDRIGADLRLAYRLTPRLTVGAEASLTGEAAVHDGHYDISTPDRLSFFGKAEYYEPCTRLQAQLTAGRFVYGDYGARLDVTRHFGDYTVGLYGLLTGGENNAGFHFSIPLGPKCQMRRHNVRLMLPEYFDWEYAMRSSGKIYTENMGKYVETRPDENRSAHYWQAVHVAQYSEKVLNGEL